MDLKTRKLRNKIRRSEKILQEKVVGIDIQNKKSDTVTIGLASSFYSDQEILSHLLKRSTEEQFSKVRTLSSDVVSADQMSKPLDKFAKARMLAHKYKKHSQPLRDIYHKSKHNRITDKQADLVFQIVKEIKESLGKIY